MLASRVVTAHTPTPTPAHYTRVIILTSFQRQAPEFAEPHAPKRRASDAESSGGLTVKRVRLNVEPMDAPGLAVLVNEADDLETPTPGSTDTGVCMRDTTRMTWAVWVWKKTVLSAQN